MSNLILSLIIPAAFVGLLMLIDFIMTLITPELPDNPEYWD